MGEWELWQLALIFLSGLWAGTINTVVGSGTLVTFPVLVSMGMNPVNAVVSNAMGLVAGGFSGAYGYRKELKTVPRTFLRLLPASLVGGLCGAALLLNVPDDVFDWVAPALIVFALVLVIFQPRLSAAVKARAGSTQLRTPDHQQLSPLLYVLVFLTGVYGGFFTAAQGVILFAIFGVMLFGSLQQSNALKVVLTLVVNIVAALSYLVFAWDRISWPVVLMVAAGSTLGGWIGGRVGRKLSPAVLRGTIVVIGLVAVVSMGYKLFA